MLLVLASPPPDRDSEDLVNTASLILLQIFQSCSGVPGAQEVEHLNGSFGPHDAAIRKRACAVVGKIKELLGNDFAQGLSSAPIMLDTGGVLRFSRRKKLGKGRKGGFDKVDVVESFRLDTGRKKVLSISKSKQLGDIFGNHMIIRTPSELSKKISFDRMNSWKVKGPEGAPGFVPEMEEFPDPTPSKPLENGESSGFSLFNCVEQLSASFEDVDSILQPLFSVLQSNKETDELQNEVFAVSRLYRSYSSTT